VIFVKATPRDSQRYCARNVRRTSPMRTILAACVALSAFGFVVATPASADVTVRTPGVVVENGGPYWRGHNDSEWRERRDFREHEFQRDAWLRDHCVRGWNGGEYCRR
jgi:hypothetical protein